MKSGYFSILLIKIYRLAFDKLSSALDKVLYSLNFPINNIPYVSQSGQKVLVCVNENILRSSRIVRWVKKNEDFYTVLLCPWLAYVPKFSNNEWDRVFRYRNKYHLLRIVRQLKHVYLYHGFIPKSSIPNLVRQNTEAPFITDTQDVYACYYGLNPSVKWIQAELPVEKECLQLSDGLVAQSLEANVALRKYGRSKPPTLFFPLYCDNALFQENNKQLDPENIHIVYAGGVAGAKRNKEQYGLIQFHELIGQLSAQKIHFHIYPSPSNFKADYLEYKMIAKENPYFHFHESVSQDQLASELNKYHFGILPFFLNRSGQSADKLKYATTLKLFNYIEAGIPVIVSKDLIYQHWIISRAKAGIGFTESDILNLKNLICATDYRKMVDELTAHREGISLKKHIHRLINFYKEVADKKGMSDK